MIEKQEPSAGWQHAHVVSLITTSAFTVAEFRCPGTPETTGIESAPYPEIVLPRAGSYLRIDAAGEVLLDRTTLAFFEANRPYSIRHFRAARDLSTVISITDTVSLHAALGVHLPSGRAFARSAIRMPADIVLAHRQMLTELAQGADGALGAEEIAAGIILRSLALNLEDQQELTRPKAQAGARDPYAIAEAVIAFLSSAFTGRVTLEQVSQALKLSPFHLCRVFQAATGNTIHQHLLHLRLEAAAAELLETDSGITEIAHAVGFSSHSHLTALFTRTFGVPPSAVRKGGFRPPPRMPR